MSCEVCEGHEPDGMCREIRMYDYKHIFIDVDSCLSGIEGINELARMRGKYEIVSELTGLAMQGEISFDEVFSRRLEIIEPREDNLSEIGKMYLAHIVSDAQAVVSALRDTGVIVSLLSGGYKDAILPMADYLGVERCEVYANVLRFCHGEYSGFDESNPLCRRGGKREVIKQLRARGRIFGPSVIIGDAVTELEARPEVDLCVGFGGFVKRDIVFDGADLFLNECTFAPLVPLILHRRVGKIIHYLPKHRRILQKGLRHLDLVRFDYHAHEIREKLFNLRNSLSVKMFGEEYPLQVEWKGY